MAPYLTAQGHRFLALDTHGSGSSPYSGSGNSIASIASDARAILNELSIKENVIVIGHSMGGIVASQLAATDSERRFKAAVLIGPVNPNPDAAAVFSKRISIVEKGKIESNDALCRPATFYSAHVVGMDVQERLLTVTI